MLRSASERKPQPQTLRVRDCYTHISPHICLWIFLNSYLSISIPLRDCSLNTYYTLLECLVRFWCYWEVLEEAEDDRCNIELVAGSEELDKTQFQEVLLEQELGGLSYIGQIRLGGSLANPCIPTDCLVDRLSLGGRQRGFSLSSLVFSSITHRRVTLYLHSSSLLFQLLYYCCVILNLAQSSLFVHPLAFILFRTYIGQIMFGGSLANLCIPTDCLVDRLPLGGQWRGFSSSSSVSSLITHRRVILCLHSSSLFFYLSYYCCVILNLAQSSLFVHPLAFTLFRTQYKLE